MVCLLSRKWRTCDGVCIVLHIMDLAIIDFWAALCMQEIGSEKSVCIEV